MAKNKIPSSIINPIPEKIDFTGKPLTQANLDKKLARQGEQKKARDSIRTKQKVADKKFVRKGQYSYSGLSSEEKLKAPIVVDEILKTREIEPIDKDVIKKVLPKGIGKTAADKVAEMINQAAMGMDSVMGVHFRDNCISWVKATTSAQMTAEQYINAVKFVSYKMAGDSAVVAYTKTFPDRVNRMAQEGMNNEYLASYAGIYSKGKIVTEVQALALVPTYLMYQDFFHLAVKTQVEIMTNEDISPKVRADAANSLMTHLKQPEIKKAELDITVRETDTIGELRDVLSQLSRKQADSVLDGEYKVIDVSNHKIIEQKDD